MGMYLIKPIGNSKKDLILFYLCVKHGGMGNQRGLVTLIPLDLAAV